MKNPRILPLLLGASLFSAFGASIIAPHSAVAQPAAPKRGGGKGARAMKGGVPKRMMTKIEESMGKPLTDDQKMKLNDAYKERTEAQKTAQAKFMDTVTMVTGLTAAQVADLNKRGPKAGAPAAMAPK